MTSTTVTDALAMAWFHRRPASGVMHHSVRGRQGASKAFQGKLKESDITCFMGRKDNCADNAPTGIWPNSFKSKRHHDHRYVRHVDMKTVSFK
jgi:transposase InsO family protein